MGRQVGLYQCCPAINIPAEPSSCHLKKYCHDSFQAIVETFDSLKLVAMEARIPLVSR